MMHSIHPLPDAPSVSPVPSIPPGQRVYAVGDIHGRLDLFEALIAAIEEDDAAARQARTTVILLGDLIDRGPDSAGVIARARHWRRQREVRILGGNHEEMFLLGMEDRDVLRHFLRFGGRETLLSYGVQPSLRDSPKELKALQVLMKERIPPEDIAFIRGFEEMIEIGGYAFVHAGILPDVPLEDQSAKDLRWIREPFLSHAGHHSHVIVHGHTISRRAELRENRIGIDTGAFVSGRLTALVLEGAERGLIEAKEEDGRTAITASKVG